MNAVGFGELSHHPGSSTPQSTWKELLMGQHLSKTKKGIYLVFWRDLRCSQTLERNASTRDLPTRKPLCVSDDPLLPFPGSSAVPPSLPAWLKGHNPEGCWLRSLCKQIPCYFSVLLSDDPVDWQTTMGTASCSPKLFPYLTTTITGKQQESPFYCLKQQFHPLGWWAGSGGTDVPAA